MRLLVCGGRDFKDHNLLVTALAPYRTTASVLIEGDAPGLDTLAGFWAEANGIIVLRFPAQWKKYGNAAGPIRNQQMIDEGKPDRVVAFPGGKGTMDMVRKARAARIEVIEVE
jgi:hypothetical protein